MYFPLNLNGITLHPLFGDFLKGEPYVFNFSTSKLKGVYF